MINRNTDLRIGSGIERVIRKQQDGTFLEVYNHWIHYFMPDGTKHSSKLDKMTVGRRYKIAERHELGMYGVEEWTDMETGLKYKIVAVPSRAF